MERKAFDELAAVHEKNENDPSVREEWAAARQTEAALA